MTEINDTTLAYAEYLVALATDEERAAAEQQKRQIVVAQLPDDEVGKPPVQSLGDYLDSEIVLPPILVEPGLVARGAISAMIARGGKGKTAISLNRFVRWGAGKPVFDDLPDLMKPTGPLKTLLIENEGAPGHFQKVLRLIIQGCGLDEAEQALARENVFVWGDGGWSGLKFDDDENFAMVDRAVSQTGADIVFVEPFRGLWRGDENSATDMAFVLDRLSEIANKHNCAVMLTHHERKSGSGDGGDPMSAARGSGVLEAVAAVMERWRPVKGDRQRELSWIKTRFDEPPADIRMSFERERWGYTYVKEEEGERQVLEFLHQFPDSWLGAKEISDELEETYHKVRKWANELADNDRVRKRSDAGKIVYAYKQGAGSDESSALAIT